MDVLDDRLDKLRNGDRYGVMRAEAEIASWVSDQSREIAQTAERSPGEAFGQLVYLTSYVNTAVGIRSSIAEKIRKHVDEVRKALATIAEGLGAASFSISAGVGLSVSLTFTVKPGE
ncbi:MAG: hypothetical protein ABIG85_02370 [Chloroflexota bacterium]